jgi:penicillin V acylase-like amidase (Ntn superfamily)
VGSSSTGEQRRLPLSDWQEQHGGFHEVSPSGADEPPGDTEEQARFVRLAYILVACKHPVPSDAEVYYHVWW